MFTSAIRWNSTSNNSTTESRTASGRLRPSGFFCAVILSEVESSLRELSAQSKDPYELVEVEGGGFSLRTKILGTCPLIGALRLRLRFADAKRGLRSG